MIKFLLNPTPWLLGGVAVVAAAAVPALAVTPQEAARQAAEDARAAASDARHAAREADREFRRWRADDGAFERARADRAARLSELLQLRPDQRPALDALLRATRWERRPGGHMARFERDEARTTLRRLDEMQARMDAQRAQADRRIAAIRAFYGQLDAAQKKRFDALPMVMVVGPSFGPMMIPHPTPIAHRGPPPPEPPPPRS